MYINNSKEDMKVIVLNVTYRCENGMREAFLDKIKAEGIDLGSRNEEGNICYEYFFSTSTSDVLFLLEKWKDAEAVEFHKKQPHFLRLGELKSEFVEETTIEKYEV